MTIQSYCLWKELGLKRFLRKNVNILLEILHIFSDFTVGVLNNIIRIHEDVKLTISFDTMCEIENITQGIFLDILQMWPHSICKIST